MNINKPGGQGCVVAEHDEASLAVVVRLHRLVHVQLRGQESGMSSSATCTLPPNC